MNIKTKDKMPSAWYNELVSLCFVQSHSGNEKLMVLYLDKWLNKHNLSYIIDNVGNIIITKGTAITYPCIVSHMDTVHDFVNDYTLHIDKKRNLFAQSGKKDTGIGGDDKCGMFACLYFLKTLPAVKVVFFTQEESGLRGSKRINKSFFDNCRYIIQLDRRGCKDFINTKFKEKTVSHSFSSEIGHVKKEFGFKTKEGSITDCINLWSDGVGVSCVNISSGYYNPHMKTEYISVDDLWNSVMFTKKLIKTLKNKRYVSIKKPTVYNSYSNNLYVRQKIICSKCKIFKIKSMGSYINNKFVCLTCSNDKSIITNTYGNYKEICDVCSISHYIKYGHYIKDVFICYSCYSKTQTNELLDELETCSVCNKEKDKTTGEYDGELFTCENCLETCDTTFTKPATELCDICQEEIPILKGFYGGGIFKCFKCIKKTRKNKIIL